MPAIGQDALSGKREWISVCKFVIDDDMTMTVQGKSCNIQDAQGNRVAKSTEKDGEVTIKVLVGYQCYVMNSYVTFRKGTS